MVGFTSTENEGVIMNKKTRHTATFTFSVVLDLARAVQALNELVSQHGVHSSQIAQ